MKKKLLSALLVLTMSIIHVPVLAQSDLPSQGDTVSGFKVKSVKELDFISSDIITFEHEKTGASVLYFANDDINRAFSIAFKTPAVNNSGITHIFEHSTLAGSEKYPSSTLWMKLSNQSYNTFMNAMTMQNTTVYPISSLSEEQLFQLSDYYLDSVFNPMIYTDESIFDREAWHYELENADSELTVDGTVYSEMLGTKTIENESLMNFRKVLFPDSYSANNSGGEPYDIPEITNDDLVEYHEKYYTPSNSLTILYGDLDYKKFLSLLDGYFAEYEKEEIEIDFENYSTTTARQEAQFDYPALQDSSGDEKSVVVYGIECKEITPAELARLQVTLDICTGYINTALMKDLPGVSLSYTIDFESAKPSIVFMATGADSSQAEEFRKIVNNEISYVVSDGVAPEVLSSVIESVKRAEAMSFEGENIGTSIMSGVAVMWVEFDDTDFYFDYLEALIEGVDDIGIGTVMATAKQYLTASRSALVTTVPKAGLAEEEELAFKQKLSDKKAKMSAEEIAEIAEKTNEYNNYTGDENAELDKELISKLSVVNAQILPEELTEYNITDTEKNGVRYITSTADIEDIGKGRIMLDVSDISEEDLHWLLLYSVLIGNIDSEKYTKEDISSRIGLYADCSTDIMTVIADNENGFTPYLIFKYEGFAEKSERMFALAEQILLKPDFSDMKHIRSLIDMYTNSIASHIRNNSYSYVVRRVVASTSTMQAYYEKMNGIEIYDFFKGLSDVSDDEIISKLDEIKEKVANKNGACVVYAGSQDSIETHTREAEKFFVGLDSSPKEAVSYELLKTDYESKAIVTDSAVNYNGIYAPHSVSGAEYSGNMDVVMNYLTDRFFIPVLRDKFNSYSILNDFDETGLSVMTYRDPEMANTFKVYSEIPEMIANGEITQGDLDKYILTVYSSYIMPRGELTDAYWAADDYMDGITYDDKLQVMREMKSTSVQKVKEYEGVFENMWNDGILFTAGNAEDVSENAHMFGEILNPFGYKMSHITILVHDDKLVTDTAAYIKNDRVMVPMRNIFEAEGAEVAWNGETREVTATKDGITVILTIDSNIIKANNNGVEAEIVLDCPVEITNDYTMIPLRAISETLGFEVGWDGETKTVTVN
ncbi:MAG: insulinase family protein [Clostridia bacterium]|nr:insulinase family protein [Clostridia bacterium]